MNQKDIFNIADKKIKYLNEQLHENLQDMAQKMARDQAVWLDKMMADILPPNLYDAGRHGDMLEEIEAYLKRHKFQIVFIPDALGIRIMRGENIHAEFKTQLTMDGEPIEKTPTMLN